MRINQQDAEKSGLLYTRYRKSLQEDYKKEIEKIEKEILAKDNERYSEELLMHNQAAFALKTQVDILKAKIVNLQTKRALDIEVAAKELDKFLRPYRMEFVRELRLIYGRLERAKKFSTFADVGTSNVGLPVRHVRTNILPVLKLQRKVSEETARFLNALLPLSQQLEHFEALNLDQLERDPSLIEEEELKIFGDNEILNFSIAFSAGKRDDPDWQPDVLPVDILDQQIKAVENFRLPKILKIA